MKKTHCFLWFGSVSGIVVLSMKVGFSDGRRLVDLIFYFFPAVSAKAAGFSIIGKCDTTNRWSLILI